MAYTADNSRRTHQVSYKCGEEHSRSISEVAEDAVKLSDSIPFNDLATNLTLTYKGVSVVVYSTDTAAKVVQRYFESLPKAG